MAIYKPATDLLKGRVILVSGASNGIGRSAAIQYAKHGATVILLARSVSRLEEIYDEIMQLGAPEPAIYPFNLAGASPKDYEELALRLNKEFSQLHGLVNNAAMIGNLTPIEHYDIRQWYTVLQTNLNAPFMLTKTCIPLLKKAKEASIIFTEDDMLACGQAYWGAYGISKYGLIALRRILADELENYTQIRVNSIYPGKVRTALRAAAFPAEDQTNLAEPESVALAYLYLMGSDSAHFTGQCLQAQAPTTERDQYFTMSSFSSELQRQ